MTDLAASYQECRRLAKRFGTTYYIATRLLPRAKRPHVWALYAFCRHADDIVDDIVPAVGAGPDTRTTDDRARDLAAFGDRFFTDLAAGRSSDPLLAAVVHTVNELHLDPEYFRRFLRSMTMDLTVDHYDTWDDLLDYMDGSAAVVGEMMLPVLDPPGPEATAPARDLGNAFQLTNFLRDVAEDLDRGRVYIPQEDFRRFGADPHRRTVDDAWRRLMRFEIARCQTLYESADRGVAMLDGSSGRCVRAARTLYSEILERIETRDFDVFTGRARVPARRKVALAARVATRMG
ncbi:MAG: phytoene/squalene synthase family protein [Ilumatobacteraceae bacterium]